MAKTRYTPQNRFEATGVTDNEHSSGRLVVQLTTYALFASGGAIGVANLLRHDPKHAAYFAGASFVALLSGHAMIHFKELARNRQTEQYIADRERSGDEQRSIRFQKALEKTVAETLRGRG